MDHYYLSLPGLKTFQVNQSMRHFHFKSCFLLTTLLSITSSELCNGCAAVVYFDRR